MYGKSNLKNGDDTYRWEQDNVRATILDSDGIDEIDLSNKSFRCVVNLDPVAQGMITDRSPSHDFVVFIYWGTIIEKVTGGMGNDEITGNDADNVLSGGNGIVDGNDILNGGNGYDTYVFNGEFGEDTVIDSDRKGVILFDGKPLGAARLAIGPDKAPSGTWVIDREDGQKIFVRMLENRASYYSFLIYRAGETQNSITVRFTRKEYEDMFIKGKECLGLALNGQQIAVTKNKGNVWLNSAQEALEDLAVLVLEETAAPLIVSLLAAALLGDKLKIDLSGLDGAAHLVNLKFLLPPDEFSLFGKVLPRNWVSGF